jgi:hypothetical protein
MDVHFRNCFYEMDHKAYMNYLLERHDELGLPYSFAMKLSFISSPLIYGKAILAVEQEQNEFIGAIGYVFGTGEDEYRDRQVAQLEVAYLEKPYRGSTLFARLLRATVDSIRQAEPSVNRLQFWAAPREASFKRLVAKLMTLPGSASVTAENGLTLYQVDFRELETYCDRWRQAA